MPTYGKQVLYTTGQPILVSADGYPEWFTVGVTVDWTTVPTAQQPTTLADGVVIPQGQKGFQYGQVLARIAASGLYGPFTPALPAAVTTTAATLAGATVLPVSSAAGILPGDTLQVDTGAPQENAVVLYVSGTNVTLAAPLANAHGSGVAVAKPNDGRQALARGQAVILNESWLQLGALPFVAVAGDHPPVLEGGLVWQARLQVGGANQPTYAQFEAAFPRIRYAHN